MAQSISVEQAKELIKKAKPLFNKDSDEAMLEILSLSVEAYAEVERDPLFEMDVLTNYIARAFYMYLTSRYYQYVSGSITLEEFGYKAIVKYNSMGEVKTIEVNEEFIFNMLDRSQSICFSDEEKEVARVARIHIETFQANFNIYKDDQKLPEPTNSTPNALSTKKKQPVSTNLSNKKPTTSSSSRAETYEGDARYRDLTKDVALSYLEELVPQVRNVSISNVADAIERSIDILRNQRRRSPQVEIFAYKDVIATGLSRLMKRNYDKLLKELKDTGDVKNTCLMVVPVNDVGVGKRLLFTAGTLTSMHDAISEICNGEQSKKDLARAKEKVNQMLSPVVDVFYELLDMCNERGITLYDNVKGQTINDKFPRPSQNTDVATSSPATPATTETVVDVRDNLVQTKRSDLTTKRDTPHSALTNTTPRTSTPARPSLSSSTPARTTTYEQVDEVEETYSSNTHKGFFIVTVIWSVIIAIVSLLIGTIFYNYTNGESATLNFNDLIDSVILELRDLFASEGIQMTVGEIAGIIPTLATRMLLTGVGMIVTTILVSGLISKKDCRESAGRGRYYLALICMAISGMWLTTIVNVLVYNHIVGKYSNAGWLSRLFRIAVILAVAYATSQIFTMGLIV